MRLKTILIALIITVSLVGSAPGAFANPKSEQHRIEKRGEHFAKTDFYRATVTSENREEGEVLRKMFNHPLQQWRENIVTTMFYVGQYKWSRVGLLNNRSSAWVKKWVSRFGGVDNPSRKSVFPTRFKPKENPFYFALPLSDKVMRSVRTNEILPEFQEITIFFNRVYSGNYDASSKKSFLQNTWIAIEFQGKTCYGQWQDVGPYCIDDANYVLRNETPKHERGKGPALDVSPAIAKYLGLNGKGVTRWRFVAPQEVPEGPWRKVISGDEMATLMVASK